MFYSMSVPHWWPASDLHLLYVWFLSSGLLRSWTSPKGRNLSLLRRHRLTPTSPSFTRTASAPPCSSHHHLSLHVCSGRGQRLKTAPGRARYGMPGLLWYLGQSDDVILITPWYVLDRNNAWHCLGYEFWADDWSVRMRSWIVVKSPSKTPVCELRLGTQQLSQFPGEWNSK